MRRILVLTPYFPPVSDSGTHRPLAFVHHLPQKGYMPTVLCLEPTASQVCDETLNERVPEGVEVERTRLGGAAEWQALIGRRTRYFRFIERILRWENGGIGKAIAWRIRAAAPHLTQGVRLEALLESAQQVVSRDDPELVWATGPPFEMLKAGAIIADRNKLPLISDYRDPWTYGLLWNPQTRMQARHEKQWERRVLRGSSRVVFTSPLTERCMGHRYPEFSKRFRTITNGFDNSLMDIVETQCSDGEFVLSFVGRTASYRRPDVLFDAVNHLQQTFPEIYKKLRIRFVGSNPGLIEEVRRRKMEQLIDVEGPVSYGKAQEVIRNSSALILLQTIDGPGADVISGKAYEYLAAGRPILAVVPKGGGDEWLIKETQSGVCAAHDDPRDVASAIVRLFQQREDGEGRRSAIINERLTCFQRQRLTQSLVEEFDTVLNTQQTVG